MMPGHDAQDRMGMIAEAIRTAVYDAERGASIRVVVPAAAAAIDTRSRPRAASLARWLAEAIQAVLRESHPERRASTVTEEAARVEWHLRLCEMDRGRRLGAKALWLRFGIRAAPLFDAQNHCWSEVDGAWADEVAVMIDEIQHRFPDTRFDQIKEKFGTLRVYLRAADPSHRAAIDAIVAACRARLAAKAMHPIMPARGEALARVRQHDAILRAVAGAPATPPVPPDAEVRGRLRPAARPDVTITSVLAPLGPPAGVAAPPPPGLTAWIVTLRRGEHTLALPWYQSAGTIGDPRVDDVLAAAVSQVVDAASEFVSSWAVERGFAPDDPEADAAYEWLRALDRPLRALLGSDEAFATALLLVAQPCGFVAPDAPETSDAPFALHAALPRAPE